MRLGLASLLILSLGAAGVARAEPLPDAGPLALDTFFDGCIDPVGARKDPGPAIEHAIAHNRHDPAAAPDPAHPEHKLWRLRGIDGDVEIETFNGKAWCEVRLIGSDPDTMQIKLNNALSRIDAPMQRRSLPSSSPGVTTEQVVVGHDSGDAFMVMVRKSREPADGEPGLTLSVSPIHLGGQGQ